ncbi:MAG: LuxR C-terminal-related transcriptional regulator [Anaerolineae bacterium]|nr:LuxR C-terminal-related transcriptional regulator [Anaerolineae bacterium]MDW8070503.1 LuxR C-terminal-related transcriptional regulator [Anaerolineae bacterium]
MTIDDLIESLLNTADGVFIVDGEQRIVYWNAAAQQLLGFSRDEALGRDCWELLECCAEDSAMEAARNRQAVAAALAGTPVSSYDTCVRTQWGKPRWINLSLVTLMTSRNPETWMAAVLFRDATRHKLNEQFVVQVLELVERMRERDALIPPATALLPPGGKLTRREYQILTLLVRGQSTRAIAAALAVSPSTVRNHIQSILTKLHVHSRLEAITYVIERGLISNP